MFRVLLFVMLSEIFASAGQILFKKTANSLGRYDLKKSGTRMLFLKEVFANRLVWFGFAAIIAGLAMWLVALSQGALSLVFPIGSVQYILILFLAHFFLGERIDSMKFIGTLLVALGIVLITLS